MRGCGWGPDARRWLLDRIGLFARNSERSFKFEMHESDIVQAAQLAPQWAVRLAGKLAAQLARQLPVQLGLTRFKSVIVIYHIFGEKSVIVIKTTTTPVKKIIIPRFRFPRAGGSAAPPQRNAAGCAAGRAAGRAAGCAAAAPRTWWKLCGPKTERARFVRVS